MREKTSRERIAFCDGSRAASHEASRRPYRRTMCDSSTGSAAECNIAPLRARSSSVGIVLVGFPGITETLPRRRVAMSTILLGSIESVIAGPRRRASVARSTTPARARRRASDPSRAPRRRRSGPAFAASVSANARAASTGSPALLGFRRRRLGHRQRRDLRVAGGDLEHGIRHGLSFDVDRSGRGQDRARCVGDDLPKRHPRRASRDCG